METGESVQVELASAPASLWGHRDFLLLWSGQSVSELGSGVTQLALPLTAVLVLKATAFQVGLLTAAAYASFALIALPAGAIVDRIAKRRLLIACDAARVIIIGSVPVAAAAGVLTLGQLYVVALLAGVCTVFFDVAYQSYLPSLIPGEQLSDGNGKLGATAAFAQAAGPGLGGALVGLIGAARALSADAGSYVVSVASLLLIRSRADGPAAHARADYDGHVLAGLREDIAEGLRFVLRHPILRKVVACTGTANFWSGMQAAVTTIFLVRVLHLDPVLIGLLYALGAIGGVAAGMFTGTFAQWIGAARIVWMSSLLFPVFLALTPLAEPGWRIALVGVGGVGTSFGVVLYNVAQLSYRQAITPPALLGRMNAAVRWIVWGTLPLGGLAGGVLGTAIGIRPTLWCAVAGSLAAALFVVFSPLRTMRDFPVHEPAEMGAPLGAGLTPQAPKISAAVVAVSIRSAQDSIVAVSVQARMRSRVRSSIAIPRLTAIRSSISTSPNARPSASPSARPSALASSLRRARFSANWMAAG
jgi:MFS family permease